MMKVPGLGDVILKYMFGRLQERGKSQTITLMDMGSSPIVWDIALNDDSFLLQLCMSEPIGTKDSTPRRFPLSPANADNADTRRTSLVLGSS